jgi:hypothetical protein
MRKIFILLIASFLSMLAYIRMDGFSLSAIQPLRLSGKAEAPSEEIRRILDQPFTYLAKGRQSFVFESEDGKYVLKLFNQKYLKYPWYGSLFRRKEKLKREIRRFYYENSYPIAHKELGEEIVYLHLGYSDALPEVMIEDRAKGEYLLNLNEFAFVLQKKGVPLYEALEAMAPKEALAGIDAFLKAIALRIEKGIADADHDVEHNWGYCDGHIFHLDPGRLYYEEMKDETRLQLEWDRATHNFYKWLKSKHPEWAPHFELRLKELTDLSKK